MNGNYNLAYGIDELFRIVGEEYLTIKLSQTFERDSVKKVFDLSPSKLFFQWQRRNQNGFSYDFLYTYSGDRFNPGIGFELLDNCQNVRGILQYGWFPGKESGFMYNRISLTGTSIWNTVTGQQETSNGIITWHTVAKKGWTGDCFITLFHEDLVKTLTLGNKQGTVLPGSYSFASPTAKYSASNRRRIAGSVSAETRSFYDGWKTSLIASPSLNIGSDLNFTMNYTLDNVNFPSRSQRFTNHIIEIRGLLTITTTTSVSAYVQYNTSIDKLMTNIRFRFNPREGNDFYIVYDEGLNSDRKREVPALPNFAGRTILLKYTHTFIYK